MFMIVILRVILLEMSGKICTVCEVAKSCSLYITARRGCVTCGKNSCVLSEICGLGVSYLATSC